MVTQDLLAKEEMMLQRHKMFLQKPNHENQTHGGFHQRKVSLEVGVCNNCMDVHVDSLEAGMRMISDIYQERVALLGGQLCNNTTRNIFCFPDITRRSIARLQMVQWEQEFKQL